eukprot:scaffold10173_cov119-Isochrysis_galbana.AAC.7
MGLNSLQHLASRQRARQLQHTLHTDARAHRRRPGRRAAALAADAHRCHFRRRDAQRAPRPVLQRRQGCGRPHRMHRHQLFPGQHIGRKLRLASRPLLACPLLSHPIRARRVLPARAPSLAGTGRGAGAGHAACRLPEIARAPGRVQPRPHPAAGCGVPPLVATARAGIHQKS